MTQVKALTPQQVKRYSRHIIMGQVGSLGQRKLINAKVLIVGAGGLGSPSAVYLALAGVGTVGIVDFDVVEVSNLQRQILHHNDDVGRPKVVSAQDSLHAYNPDVNVVVHETMLSSENAMEIIEQYDIVINGADNFPCRYLVNDACVLTGKPNVYGSIFRFEGQVSVFNHDGGPCYRCLYAEPPPPGLVPSCAEGGVFGVLPGIVGAMQANEVIKLLLGVGDVASGRYLLFDALKLSFRELRLRRNPGCPVCGESPTVTELIDYEQFCGIPSGAAAEEDGVPEIDVHELASRLDNGSSDGGSETVLIDVREPFEHEINCIEQAQLIPLGELPGRLSELSPTDSYVIHCKMGGRSAKAVELMRSQGFTDVVNLAGGIDAWVEEIDPDQPSY
jgi:adenylyltransferase/sulfurtransferase